MSNFRKGFVTGALGLGRAEALFCIGCTAMIAGMLFSRAMLSVAMVVLVINALFSQGPILAWRTFWGNPYAKMCLFFFGTYLVSGLWSHDKDNWLSILQIKLPFFFLPFVMVNAPLASVRVRLVTLIGVLLALFIGMCYSYYFWIIDPASFRHKSHLHSPLEGDYIRFTIALVLGIQLALYLLIERKVFSLPLWSKFMIAAWCACAIFYIHIQAAKSGLICFYMGVFIYSIYYVVTQRKWSLLLGAVAFFAGSFYLGYRYVPFFQKQIHNISYEQEVWEQGDKAKYGETVSFVPRLISYKIVWGIIKAKPWTGAGAGDLKGEMDAVYRKEYPQIEDAMKLLPHNQFLCSMGMTGIPLGLSVLGLIVFSLYRIRMRIYAITTTAVMTVGLMIEPLLETQYGVFVYLFFTLFWVGTLKRKRGEASP